ncbi:uncharacterized protein [Diadema antillarum]|uniref:uncharacterized protein n=1 Tax=Diadema antillarum TaxID=105358 RepID=UPI003A8B9120
MALSKSSPESFKEDLTCGICNGKLQDGHFLRCFHSFCKACLKEKRERNSSEQRGIIANVATGMFRVATHMFTAHDTAQTDYEFKLTCPVCERDGKGSKTPESRQYVFPNIVADIKIDSMDFTQKVREKAKDRERLVCESCQENDCKVASYCADCHQFICSSCVDAHKKLSLTRGHSILEVDDIENGKSLIDVKREKANPACPVHPSSTISLLCTVCQVAICLQCRETDLHRLHPCVDINEGLKPFLVEAQMLVDKVGPERFDKITVDFLQHKKEIAETAEQLRKQVNDDAQATCAELLKQVEEKRISLLAKISRVESESNKATDSLIKAMGGLRSKAEKAEWYVDILNRHGTNSDILSARQGGFLDLLRDLGTEVTSQGSCRTNATLKLHTRSFPFPRYQLKWYTPVYTE